MHRPPHTSATVPSVPDQPARRRVLKGSLATAPVLLTLASRPVLGGQCAVTSAFVSLAGSRTAAYQTCQGKSPSVWASAKDWPTPYFATAKNGAHGHAATPYHCTTTGLNGTAFQTSTMLDVLALTGGGTASLGRHISAALLNAKAGLTPVLDEARVRAMWNDFVLRGRFEPTAGVSWGAAEIVTYIKSTIA
jgi:hypothetical protein